MKLHHLLLLCLLALPGSALAAATDDFAGFSQGLDSPYRNAAAITPHDTNELANVTRAIYVGGAGNIVLVTAAGNEVTLSGCLAGHVYRVRAKQVKSTSTTATNLIALW